MIINVTLGNFPQHGAEAEWAALQEGIKRDWLATGKMLFWDTGRYIGESFRTGQPEPKVGAAYGFSNLQDYAEFCIRYPLHLAVDLKHLELAKARTTPPPVEGGGAFQITDDPDPGLTDKLAEIFRAVAASRGIPGDSLVKNRLGQ